MHAKITLVGIAPLLQHNIRLADPLDSVTKAIAKVSKKRNKTEADLLELSRLEFEGGLYWSKELGPYVPGSYLDKAIEVSARTDKLGTLVKASVQVLENEIPLQYKGPRDVDGLWSSDYYLRTVVTVQRAKCLRTRPIFKDWKIDFTVLYDENFIEVDKLVDIIKRAGQRVGIGDYRPRYGRFEVEATQ